MKTTLKFGILIFGTIIASLLFLFSCKDKNTPIPTPEKENPISLWDEEMNLIIGDTKEIRFSLNDESLLPEVTFRSDNENVAIVSEKGKVTALGEGNCKIEVKVKEFSKTLIVNVKAPEVKRLQIGIYDAGMPGQGEVQFHLPENGEIELPILSNEYIVAVYDEKYVGDEELKWENETPELFIGSMDPPLYGYAVTTATKEGTAILKVTYKGETAVLRLKIVAQEGLLTELPSPRLEWGATAEQIKAWETSNGGTFSQKRDADGKAMYEYTVSNNENVSIRAYIFDENDHLIQAIAVTNQVEKIYDISDDSSGGKFYMPKEPFFTLLLINHVEGLQADLKGTGAMKGVLRENKTKDPIGINIYPDFTTIKNPSEVVKYVIFSYSQIKE